jgi:hypothetical protein
MYTGYVTSLFSRNFYLSCSLQILNTVFQAHWIKHYLHLLKKLAFQGDKPWRGRTYLVLRKETTREFYKEEPQPMGVKP